jgi:hypothetical protein
MSPVLLLVKDTSAFRTIPPHHGTLFQGRFDMALLTGKAARLNEEVETSLCRQ